MDTVWRQLREVPAPRQGADPPVPPGGPPEPPAPAGEPPPASARETAFGCGGLLGVVAVLVLCWVDVRVAAVTAAGVTAAGVVLLFGGVLRRPAAHVLGAAGGTQHYGRLHGSVDEISGAGADIEAWVLDRKAYTPALTRFDNPIVPVGRIVPGELTGALAVALLAWLPLELKRSRLRVLPRRR